MEGPARKGFHRVAWDLRYSSQGVVSMGRSSSFGGGGFQATPGTYTVTLSRQTDGKITPLAGPISFEVERLYKGVLQPASDDAIASFRQKMESIQADVAIVSYLMNNSMTKVNAMQTALSRTRIAPGDLDAQLHDLQQKLYEMEEEMSGNQSKEEIGERNPPSFRSRMFMGYRGLSTTYGPTPMHKESLEIAMRQMKSMKAKVEKISEQEIPRLEKALQAAGAPWIEGQALPKN